MTPSAFDFEQQYEFSPEVVWDALVDADLVSGWLAEADIDQRIGGRYDLQWVSPISTGSTMGEIADLLEFEVLVVELERIGTVTFRLQPIAGGSRGTATILTVRVDSSVERRLADGFAAAWLTSLEQLDELLRGHPVDWSSWTTDHGARWSEHLARLRTARAIKSN